jgi:aerotolerance regulator-like protein/VWA domain-containing protein
MSLLAPAFLLGLLAVGLPLWLHRLSSTNPNKQRFSSLMFLEPGEPRRVLAKKLQYLLLLALRIGVLVLLALAFAQPAIWRTPAPGDAEDARLHVIVLDGSASMAYGDRWERARAAAGEVIDSLGGEDRAQLIAAGRTVEVLGAPTGDTSVLRQTLNTMQPGVFRLDYGQLMRAIDGVVRGAEMPVVIDLVTDVQQSSVPTRFGELAPRRPAEIAIHDVGGAASNWALDSFGGSALTGELEAGVRSFAAEVSQRTLRLTLNGNTVAEQTVEVPAGGRAQARFPPLDLASGSNRVSVELAPGDDLAADDRRFLALKRPQPRAVLLVAADLRGRGPLYTSAALATLETMSLTPEIKAANALGERPLTDYSFVVITDAGLLGAGEAAQLTDYVQGGGRVLIAFGPRSASLTTVPVGGQVLRTGSQLGAATRPLAIGELDSGHPALRGVDELRTARFNRYLAVEPAADDRVLIRLDDGTPLLVERTVGTGRVLLFTSSLDREWNDLPVQPVFVPFMAGLANYLLGGAGFTNEAELGSTLAVRAMGLAGGQIFDPRGEKALALGGGEDVLLDQVGFYEVAGGGATELVAVNFDPRESDLARIDEQTVERWTGLGVRADAQTQAGVVTGADEPVANPLGPWLVILLLVIAIVESLVGNWHLRIRRGLAA